MSEYLVDNNPNSDKQIKRELMRRLAPPVAFIAAICLLVICCYDSGYSGLPPTEKRYEAAKAGIASLKQDGKKSGQREPWEKLAAEFRSIYEADPAWPNRAAALFRAAESLEELARRSCSRADAKKAVNCYEKLALRHASSRLADDALFRAAKIRAASLRDEKGALTLLARLKQQYPKGDMLAEAIALERAIKASTNGKTAPEALKIAATVPADIKEDQPRNQISAQKTGGKFVGDLPLRYKAAKSRMAALRKDSTRSCWRQPWEEIREEFLRIHKTGKNHLAACALYQAAVCQQALAMCSRLAADSRKAIKIYISVSDKFPKHALADDALLNAARLEATLPDGRNRSIALLDRIISGYPRGDMFPDAKKLRSIWQDSGKAVASAQKQAEGKKPRKPELQVLSWDSINKNRVEIVLEMSAPTTYEAKLVETSKGSPARLLLALDNADVVSDVRNGVTVQGSLLKAVRVRDSKNGGTTLQFDFRDVKRFDARSEDDPCRIVLSVAAGNTPLPKKNQKAILAASRDKEPNRVSRAVKARQVSDMASQLGLTVHKVFIDAGHGGKDPGTSHNKIMERMITLDVALALGRLLEANGLEVAYSRKTNKTLALSERTRLANAANADLFISIHINANDNPRANGFETYYLDLASNTQAARVAMLENAISDRRLGDMQRMLADVMLNARVDESRRLARDIQRLSMFRMKKRNYEVRDNGVKSAPFHVLLGARMPAVLVELGYCSNSREAANLATPKYRHALAEGLAEGILAYKNRLLKNRTARNGLTGNAANAM